MYIVLLSGEERVIFYCYDDWNAATLALIEIQRI